LPPPTTASLISPARRARRAGSTARSKPSGAPLWAAGAPEEGVGAAGGAPAINFCRSLRAGEDEDIWGIRCAAYIGANRVRQADNCAEHLRHVEGLEGKLVRVFHERDESIVFYGRYKRLYKDGTNQAAFQPDPDPALNLIRSLSMENPPGSRQMIWPFRLATLGTYPVPMSVPRASRPR